MQKNESEIKNVKVNLSLAMQSLRTEIECFMQNVGNMPMEVTITMVIRNNLLQTIAYH